MLAFVFILRIYMRTLVCIIFFTEVIIHREVTDVKSHNVRIVL